MITGIHLIGEETLRRDAERLEKLRAAERAVVATAADAYGAVTDAEEELKEAKSREPKWCIATLLDEAGPTASHGGSFVHQGQSHPGEHSRQTSINRERRDRHV
jgi:hypothetical protein